MEQLEQTQARLLITDVARTLLENNVQVTQLGIRRFPPDGWTVGFHIPQAKKPETEALFAGDPHILVYSDINES